MVEIETLPPDQEDEGKNQEECWEPLAAPQITSTPQQRVALVQDDVILPRSSYGPTQRRSSRPPPPSNFSSRSTSIVALQQRVQLRRHLKQRLVDHPLQLVWSHWLWHLGREFWALNLTIRVAVILVALGAICKVACCMTWYMWYPRSILLVVLGLGGWCYVDPNGIPRLGEEWVQALMHLPQRIPETLEALDPSQLRRLALVLFYVPTLLQMRTISFLADMNATGGGWRWNVVIVLLMMALSYGIRSGMICHQSGMLCHQSRGVPPYREVAQRCLLVLYGSAMLKALSNFQLLTMPSLAAPFFLSTGTLLLSSQDHDNMEWFSKMVRYSLRLTLRDVLATVGNSVQEDEMLQLAMLRWIVDYWSSSTNNSGADNANNGSSSNTNNNNSSGTSNSSDTKTETRPNRPQTNNRQELQWDELFPMLNMATDQMTTEVQSLQQQSAQQPAGIPVDIPHSRPNTNNNAASSSSTTTNNNNDPLQDLHAMLASMNIDGRAKPAVLAYKRTVLDFPPSRTWATLVSVSRRCPTCLVVLWQILVASMYQPITVTFVILCLLTPLVVLEALRIQAWIRACQQLSDRVVVGDQQEECTTDNEQEDRDSTQTSSPASGGGSKSSEQKVSPLSKALGRVDPMIILLSGDDDMNTDTSYAENTNDNNTPCAVPTLLLVWQNISSSVHALEVSLTAARCVHTGAVAVEFAKNIMSIAQLGVEVSQYGWMHGLGIILKEVIFHDPQYDPAAAALADPSTSTHALYTHAARSAVHNGQTVARNLRFLAQNEEHQHLQQVLGPIAGVFGFIGSLFKGGNLDQNQPSQKTNEPAENADDTKSDEAITNDGKSEPVEDTKESWESCATGTQEQHQQQHIDAEATITTDAVHDSKPTISSKQKGIESSISAEELPEKSSVANDVLTSQVIASVRSTEISKIKPTCAEDPPALPKVETVLDEVASELPLKEPTLPKEADGSCKEQSDYDDISPASIPDAGVGPEIVALQVDETNEDENTKAGQQMMSNDVNQAEHSSKLSEAKLDADVAPAGSSGKPDELAEVMDLISVAFERELLDETEKNEFCLKLSSDKGTEMVLGMKRTLQGLLASGEQEQSYEPLALQGNREEPGNATNKKEQQTQSGGVPTSAVAESNNNISSEITEHDSELLEDGWYPIAESEASSPREDAVIQSLDYSDKVASAVNTRGALAIPKLSDTPNDGCAEGDGIPTVASAPPEKEKDDVWVKVGGGLAVLGAVVGGAFLAMNQGNDNNKEETTEKKKSSIEIERLDDDDAAGGQWEAAGKS